MSIIVISTVDGLDGIILEIEIAALRLGGGGVLADIRGWASTLQVECVYDGLELLGAGPELLAIIGRWRTAADEEVLRDLRNYNNSGEPFLETEMRARWREPRYARRLAWLLSRVHRK